MNEAHLSFSFCVVLSDLIGFWDGPSLTTTTTTFYLHCFVQKKITN